jgi:anti-sigma factor ChrR (cupin superfamily)
MSDPKQPATDEQLDAAALAALGFLPPSEAMAALRSSIVQMQETLALLVKGVPLVTPPPTVRERLLARVAAFEQLRPIADVRRNEDTWVHSGMPGVDIKTLFTEPALGRSTYLVRMDPGARLPGHRHGDVEQCMVLEGDIRWGDLAYEKGDFVVMDKGTEHPEIYTVHGNLLLLIAGRNEFQHAR